jgi:hypothetical protein
MRPRFLRAVQTFRCSHQFSWPRRWRDGNYYQVCVRCGAEYLYDWNSMQRAGRFQRDGNPAEPAAPSRGSSWRPRARRISIEMQIHFRQPGSQEWRSGTIRNVSETGVLIAADGLLPPGAEVELKFVMPKEISGQEGALVVTSGTVARVLPDPNSEGGRMAATIQVCRFLSR